MIDFDEACRRLEDLAGPLPSEAVDLDDADGRVLAEDVVARRDSPEHPVSAMDGYAIAEAELAAGRRAWRVEATVFAGDGASPSLPPDACARIFTGAPLPAGLDRVVPQEAAQRAADRIVVEPSRLSGRHVRARGSDFRIGQRLLPRGRTLDPGALLLAAAADRPTLAVVRQPRVAIISSGDELVPPGQALERLGRVPDSVSFGVASLARRWGAGEVRRRHARDDLDTLKGAVAEAQDWADLIVMTGGASVGERDFARAAFDRLELIVDKVAMKPGKPVWVGRAAGTLVVGLPGNPTAAMVTARLFLAPILALLTGRPATAAWAWREAPAAGAFPPAGERELFVRAHATDLGATACGSQDSSAQAVMAEWNLLVRRAAGAPAAACGDRLRVLPL